MGKVFGTTPTCSLNSRTRTTVPWLISYPVFDFHSCSHHHILFAWSLPRWQKYTITTYTVAFLSSVSGIYTTIIFSIISLSISFHFPCSFHFSRPISSCLLPIKLAPKVSVFPGRPRSSKSSKTTEKEKLDDGNFALTFQPCQNLH